MSQRPPTNEWLTPGVILTLIGAAITGFASYQTFNSTTDKRLQRVEDRTEIMWQDWVNRHDRGGSERH